MQKLKDKIFLSLIIFAAFFLLFAKLSSWKGGYFTKYIEYLGVREEIVIYRPSEVKEYANGNISIKTKTLVFKITPHMGFPGTVRGPVSEHEKNILIPQPILLKLIQDGVTVTISSKVMSNNSNKAITNANGVIIVPQIYSNYNLYNACIYPEPFFNSNEYSNEIPESFTGDRAFTTRSLELFSEKIDGNYSFINFFKYYANDNVYNISISDFEQYGNWETRTATGRRLQILTNGPTQLLDALTFPLQFYYSLETWWPG